MRGCIVIVLLLLAAGAVGSGTLGYLIGDAEGGRSSNSQAIVALDPAECPSGLVAGHRYATIVDGGFERGGSTGATFWECVKP